MCTPGQEWPHTVLSDEPRHRYFQVDSRVSSEGGLRAPLDRNDCTLRSVMSRDTGNFQVDSRVNSEGGLHAPLDRNDGTLRLVMSRDTAN